jgi:hypothetical protein
MEGPSSSTNFESQSVYLKFSIRCPTLFRNGRRCERVTLTFPEDVNTIYVTLPRKTDSVSTARLKFTFINPNWEISSPEKLKVTIGKIKGLGVKILYYLQANSTGPYQAELRLRLDADLVPGRMYTLNFTSLDELKPSIELIEEKQYTPEEMASRMAAEFRKQVTNMGAAEARSASSEDREKLMGDRLTRLIQAARKFDPSIKMPTDNPSPFTLEYLNSLPLEKLQEMFESANISGIKIAIARLKAASLRKIVEINDFNQQDKDNSELITRIRGVIEGKGATAYLPTTQQYLDLVREEKEILDAQLANIKGSCSIQ